MASSSSYSFPDLYSWIETLPPIPQWKPNSSIFTFNLSRPSSSSSSSSSSKPSIKVSIRNPNPSSLTLSIYADYRFPITLWTSKTITLTLNPSPDKLTDPGNKAFIESLTNNFVEDVLNYASIKCPYSRAIKLPNEKDKLKDVFNFCFLTLSFVVCIYEAPGDLRGSCLNTLKDQFASPKARDASRVLIRVLGSNTEEIWMRSINLAITNWILELKSTYLLDRSLSPLFSHSLSTLGGLWKVQVYCPIVAMSMERSNNSSLDDHLEFSLNFHQLESVIQLNYKVGVREKWIDVMVNVDNIRCDVVKLLSDTLLSERGAGTSEKHFPSRIALQITPTLESNIIAVSVGKSSDNPAKEITVEKGIEASFEPPSTVGLNFSTAESASTTIKPWKFEQSVFGNAANLNWFLHDSTDGREVFSSRPSRLALINHKAWFKHRYSNAGRAFTRQGGVVFAGDEYGERVWWKVDRACVGRTMEWTIKGWIWATYWPNKYRSSYSETRKLEFREVLHLNLNGIN
ncbi:uncharacterized protein LOC127245775 [Andrographis paniculata]|uniref:uncharacterized protein LOC127245775 n=1 Tax=Andrographis paniculata TaxID=175694 RepID=UPI0021E73A1F|nr:uncharacterized protein LOC127245775 [Andrographis paniculata]